MAFTNYLENILLNTIFGKLLYFPASSLTMGLSLADPTDDESGLSEPGVVAGYWRIETYPSQWATAALGVVKNTAVLTFPTAVGSWGELKFFALFDYTAMVIYGELDNYINIGIGEQPRFNIGQVTILLG